MTKHMSEIARITKLRKSARAALKAGLKIVACNAASKIPHKGFCPRGADSATDSYAEVMRWFDKDPTINLAALLKGSDVLVIDIDGPKGKEALKKLGAFPETRMTKTRNGEHHFLRYSGSAIGSRIKLFPELDIIASGYVMLPGSVHPDGGVYTCDDIDAPIADVPPRMLAVIRKAKSKEKVEGGGDGPIKKGKRNDRLAAIAGSLRRQGLDAEMIDTILQQVNDEYCDPPLSEDEVGRIAQSIGSYALDSDALFASMADVEPEDVEFLWYPYVVAGALNLLEGDPNVGKTFMLCKMAADLSAGRALPGQGALEPMHVIFLSAEDDPATTLVKRLMRMRADLANITYQTEFVQLDAEGLNLLEGIIEEKKAKLVILDPLLAYMRAGIDMNKANETRPFLAELGAIARNTGAAIIGLRHITKGDKDKAIYSGLGSIDIVAAARSAVMIGLHPEDENIRVFTHSKHNLSIRGDSLMYELADGDHRKGIMPRVKWGGTTELTANDLVSKKGAPGRPDDTSQEAQLFLRQSLADGPKPISQVVEGGEKRGFADRTLRRAAKAMGIEKIGRTWKLPEESRAEK